MATGILKRKNPDTGLWEPVPTAGIDRALADTRYADKARVDPGPTGTAVTLPHIVRSSRWHSPAGNGVADDRAVLQALLDASDDVFIDKQAGSHYRIVGPLVPHAGQTITLHPQVIIEQVTHYQPVFDLYDVDDVVIRGNGALLRYTGSRVWSGSTSFRGSNNASYGAAVWCNGNRCKVHDLRVYGFRSGVFLSGYVTASGAQVAYSKFDNEVHGLAVDTVDFGLLASGQVNPVVRDISGSYAIESGSGDPAHLIYFSDAAASRRIDIDGANAYGGVGGGAFQFKACYGGKAVNLFADTCQGTLSLTKDSGLTVQVRHVNDQSFTDENGSVYIFGDSGSDVVTNCTVDVEIEAADTTTGYRLVRVGGSRNTVRVKGRTRATTTTTLPAVAIYGNDHDVSVSLVNTDAGGTDLATGRGAVTIIEGARHRVHLGEARNFNFGVSVQAAVTDATVSVDAKRVKPIPTAGTAFNIISAATTALAREGVQTFTVSGGLQVRPDSSLYRTARLTVTDATAFIFGGIYGTPPQGTRLTVIVDNQSGGAMGTMTWAGVTLATAWAAPAAGATKTVELVRDGATWKEIGRTA